MNKYNLDDYFNTLVFVGIIDIILMLLAACNALAYLLWHYKVFLLSLGVLSLFLVIGVLIFFMVLKETKDATNND